FQTVTELIKEFLHAVLVSVLLLAHDASEDLVSWADAYPPRLSEAVVRRTLDYLEVICRGSKGSSLVMLLLRKRDGLQLVLEGLRGGSGDRCPLPALGHLVDMVVPHLSTTGGLGGSGTFVVRTLSLELLRQLPTGTALTKKEDVQTLHITARLLRNLYEASGMHFHEEVERNLPDVINALTPFLDVPDCAITSEVRALVEVLLSEESLESSVLRVLPLPSSCEALLVEQRLLEDARSRGMQGDISQVLKVFVRSLTESPLTGSSTCTLTLLARILRSSRSELLALLAKVQG
ncbi:unnamed protein product, partial [Ixodes hexagonus]